MQVVEIDIEFINMFAQNVVKKNIEKNGGIRRSEMTFFYFLVDNERIMVYTIDEVMIMNCYIIVSSEPFSDFVEILLCTTEFKSVSEFLRGNKWSEDDNIRVQVWNNSHIIIIYEYNVISKQLEELWSEVETEEVK